ncbi:MAG: trypsin-like serine protease [Phycisphaerae bacterium]
MRRTNPVGWIVSIVALSLLCQPASGIVMTEDPSLHLVDPQSPFAMVGYLNTAGGTSGVLIGPNKVLTANHCVSDISSATFSLDTAEGRKTWAVESKSALDEMDLAVLTLSESTGLSGAAVYEGNDEAGHLAAMVGYGYSGVGQPDTAQFPRGTARVGYSMIDYALSRYLISYFDQPGSSGSQDADEGAATTGDSGGGIFIRSDGEWVLAGLHRYVRDGDDDGIFPEFGDQARGIRLSQASSWLADHLTPVPEPGTMVLLTLGGLVLTVRRRVR